MHCCSRETKKIVIFFYGVQAAFATDINGDINSSWKVLNSKEVYQEKNLSGVEIGYWYPFMDTHFLGKSCN